MEEVNPLLQAVASDLSLRVVRPLSGGEFGAVLAVDTDRRELVLKVLPSPELAPRFAQGAELAARLRGRGYPASRYVGTGATRQAAWSLQELMPGEVPDVMAMPHAERLVALASMHAGAAGRSAAWQGEKRERMRLLSRQLGTRDAVRPLATELAQVIDASDEIHLLEDGIVHGDFHHRNYLAVGDEVTGVFDWELASVGDWRSDLVTLAFWSSIVTEQVPRDVAAYVTDEMINRCPSEVIAFFAACCAIQQLDFDARVHPDRLSGLMLSIEERIGPWWRQPG